MEYDRVSHLPCTCALVHEDFKISHYGIPAFRIQERRIPKSRTRDSRLQDIKIPDVSRAQDLKFQIQKFEDFTLENLWIWDRRLETFNVRNLGSLTGYRESKCKSS